jgi:membrane protease YdiL (CAAX protease family)
LSLRAIFLPPVFVIDNSDRKVQIMTLALLAYMIKDSWSRIYRRLALVNAVIAAAWTLILIARIKPLSYLLPIMAEGGPGTWLILGYILFIIIGFCGFIGFSTLYEQLEEEGRVVDGKLAAIGLLSLFIGATLATMLLGVGGAIGGYARSVQHLPTQQVQAILEPFVDIITAFTIIAVLGVLFNVVTIIRSKQIQGE